jgi:hypothetical protein
MADRRDRKRHDVDRESRARDKRRAASKHRPRDESRKDADSLQPPPEPDKEVDKRGS